MTDFYVYVHRKATTGEIFYVGKGKDTRAFDTSDRGKHWHNTVNKHGHTVEIVNFGLQEWYALELEIDLIAYHGRMNLGHGPLVNKTDGGEGVCGQVITEETREKLRISHIGNASNLGKPHSEEAKQKIREKQNTAEAKERLKEMQNNHKGYVHSVESKNKMSIARKGKPLTDEWRLNIKLGWDKRRARDSVNMNGANV